VYLKPSCSVPTDASYVQMEGRDETNSCYFTALRTRL